MAGIVLTPDDHRTLQEMLAWWKDSKGNTTNRPRSKLEVGTQPEVYMARTDGFGIPALGHLTGTGPDDDPGVGTCDIFRLIGPSGDKELVQVTGLQKKAYNFSRTSIPPYSHVTLVRDKFGDWVATEHVSFSGIGVASSLHNLSSGGAPVNSIVPGLSPAWDTEPYYDSVAGTITFPIEGYYLVNVSVAWAINGSVSPGDGMGLIRIDGLTTSTDSFQPFKVAPLNQTTELNRVGIGSKGANLLVYIAHTGGIQDTLVWITLTRLGVYGGI